MKRILAFLLVVCAGAMMMSPPALGAANTANPITVTANVAKALLDSAAVVRDADGNSLKMVEDTGDATKVNVFKADGTTAAPNAVAYIDLSGVDCTQFVADDVTAIIQATANQGWGDTLKYLKLALTSTVDTGVTIANVDTAVALKELDLSGSTGLASITFTATSAALETVNLTGCNWKAADGTTGLTVADVATLPELTTLIMDDCSTYGLTASNPGAGAIIGAAAANLTTLSMKNCTSVSSITTFSNMTGLVTLDVSGCSALNGLTLDAANTKLKTVIAGNCAALESFVTVADNTSLKNIYVNDCPGLTTLTPKSTG